MTNVSTLNRSAEFTPLKQSYQEHENVYLNGSLDTTPNQRKRRLGSPGDAGGTNDDQSDSMTFSHIKAD